MTLAATSHNDVTGHRRRDSAADHDVIGDVEERILVRKGCVDRSVNNVFSTLIWR